MEIKPITVNELNNYIKEKVDEDDFLNNVYVKGEISNCKLHYTGHIYFTYLEQFLYFHEMVFTKYTAKQWNKMALVICMRLMKS